VKKSIEIHLNSQRSKKTMTNYQLTRNWQHRQLSHAKLLKINEDVTI